MIFPDVQIAQRDAAVGFSDPSMPMAMPLGCNALIHSGFMLSGLKTKVACRSVYNMWQNGY